MRYTRGPAMSSAAAAFKGKLTTFWHSPPRDLIGEGLWRIEGYSSSTPPGRRSARERDLMPSAAARSTVRAASGSDLDVRVRESEGEARALFLAVRRRRVIPRVLDAAMAAMAAATFRLD